MPDPRQDFGDSGEDLAAAFLEREGLRVIERKVNTAFGEIDLVCEDGEEIVFVEVKTRSSEEYGFPEEAITPLKFRHLVAAAEALLTEHGWERRWWRLDVVAIRLLPGGGPEIVHLKAIDRPAG
jgi:putative endonuclease